MRRAAAQAPVTTWASRAARAVLRLLALGLLAVLALQLYFALRIGLMAMIDPSSTTFQRSEMRRLLGSAGALPWRQSWTPRAQFGTQLPRAVIASEDAGFTEHSGIEWEAVEQAWTKNERAAQRAERRAAQRAPGPQQPAQAGKGPPKPVAKVVGGSTISQQLAKNLFLSGERTLLRKAQEAAITLMLEAVLSKSRLLEIYLNHVEWGEGVFGAQAAARHYFRLDVAQLSPWQAARLAVMLPAPKRYEKRPDSPYLAARATTIVGRMASVTLP